MLIPFCSIVKIITYNIFCYTITKKILYNNGNEPNYKKKVIFEFQKCNVIILMRVIFLLPYKQKYIFLYSFCQQFSLKDSDGIKTFMNNYSLLIFILYYSFLFFKYLFLAKFLSIFYLILLN